MFGFPAIQGTLGGGVSHQSWGLGPERGCAMPMKYQVKYDQCSRTFAVWRWDELPRKAQRVAQAFRREGDAYEWIHQNTSREDKVYPTLFN